MKFSFDWPSEYLISRCLKCMSDGQTDEGVCLHYKLTNEPKGLGELVIVLIIIIIINFCLTL